MKKILPFVLLLCVVFPQFVFAGAWTLPKNNLWMELYTKFNTSKYEYGTDRSLNRKSGSQNAWSWGYTVIPKAEYGVTDWLTALGGFEFKNQNYKEYGRPDDWGPYSVRYAALTNVHFGARVRILKDPLVMSGQIKAQIYSGDGKQAQPELSDGDDMIELRALFGKTFDTEIPFYLAGEVGYGLRNRAACNSIPLFVEGGFWPTEWLLLKTELDVSWAAEGTGNIEKDWAIWRIGPVIQFYDLYELFRQEDAAVEQDFMTSVTRQNRAINLEFQYGNIFWGKNTSADHEFVIKASAQF